MDWIPAPDIENEIHALVKELEMTYIKPERIFCFRSFGSSSRARARIWSLSRIWQQALNVEPAYCVEVLSERFDNLDYLTRKRILVHELMHIPKNFTGSLLAHRKSKGKSYEKRVELLFQQLLNAKRK